MKKIVSLFLTTAFLLGLIFSGSVFFPVTSKAATVPVIKLQLLQHGTQALAQKAKYYDVTLAEINKRIEKELGFKIDPVYTSYADDVYGQKLNLDLATGKEIDMFNLDPGSLKLLAEKKMLKDLSSFVKDSAPNFVKNNPENVWDEVRYGKTIFALPITGFSIFNVSWIRGEWLNKAKLSMPKNIREFEKVLLAFRDKDLDGNGRKDTIPYGVSLNDAEMVLLSSFTNTPGDYYDSKLKKIMPKYNDIGYKKFIETLSRWYKINLIDDQLFNGDMSSFNSLYAQNKMGVFTTNCWDYEWGPLKGTSTSRPEMKTELMKQFDSGIKKYASYGLVGDALAASATSKNAKYAVMYHDWYMYNTDNYYLVKKGIKGKSYDIKNSSVIVPSTEKANSTVELSGYFSVGNIAEQEFKYWPETTPEESKTAYKYCVAVPSSKVYVPVTKFISTVVPDDIKIKKADADSMAKQYVQDIIKGKKSLKDYATLLKKYDEMGGYKYYELLTKDYGK